MNFNRFKYFSFHFISNLNFLNYLLYYIQDAENTVYRINNHLQILDEYPYLTLKKGETEINYSVQKYEI